MPKIVRDEEIFTAVIETIIERGYAGATTKQIAEKANISEVTLFRRFGSKPELVKQAVSAIIKDANFDAAAKFTGDVEADLLNVVRTYRDSAIHYSRFVFTMLSEMMHYSELSDAISIPYKIFKSIAKLIKKYQSEGVLIEEDPYHALASLLGPLVFSSVMKNVEMDSRIHPIDLQRHVSLFLNGRIVK